MAVNRTSKYQGYKQEPPQPKVVYQLKVKTANPVESQNSGNLYLRVQVVVNDGPAKGHTAGFPAFTFMMQDAHGDEAKSGGYQDRAMDAAFEVLGYYPPAVFPTEEGESTDFTQALEGALFYGTIKPADNPRYWDVDEVHGPYLPPQDEAVLEEASA